ncbi:hypothetical protein C8R47DRAFT_1279884 [Mycena vitilis]|nr:hypothetical protein C8R47DRAFT_1279884 [Mycena vitilis]
MAYIGGAHRLRLILDAFVTILGWPIQHRNPELTESQLLNANNQTPVTGRADVAVAGAGILGLCHTIHLKHVSPQPALSPFSTFTTGDILPYDYLLRLFGLKDGIQFYSVDRKGVSFQLDRRVSELFFTMAQQLDVTPRGTVRPHKHPLQPLPNPKVLSKGPDHDLLSTLDMWLVFVASGFSRRLTVSALRSGLTAGTPTGRTSVRISPM